MNLLCSLGLSFPWCKKRAAPVAPMPTKRRHGKLDPETLFQPRYARSQKVLMLEVAMTGGWFTKLHLDEHLQAKGNRSICVGKRWSELRTMLEKLGVVAHERDIKLASGKTVKECRLPLEAIRKLELMKAGLKPCSL